MLQGERLAERKKKQLESYLRGDGVTLFYHMTHTGGTTLVRRIINHADNLPDIVHTASTYNLGNIKLVPLKKARASNFIDYLNLTRKADGAHVNHMNFGGLMPKDGGFPWESEDIFSFTTVRHPLIRSHLYSVNGLAFFSTYLICLPKAFNLTFLIRLCGFYFLQFPAVIPLGHQNRVATSQPQGGLIPSRSGDDPPLGGSQATVKAI